MNKYQGDLTERPGLREGAMRAALKLGENKNQGDLTERPGLREGAMRAAEKLE